MSTTNQPVFLVLDSSDSANILRRKLRSESTQCLLAKTNTQAITMLDERLSDISCVIVDVQLAHNSSFEFLYELRSYPDMKDVPIIVYSSKKLPNSVTRSTDWKLFSIAKVFYKSKDSVEDVCRYANSFIPLKTKAS